MSVIGNFKCFVVENFFLEYHQCQKSFDPDQNVGPELSCRTATLDFFFDLAESKVAVFLCSILTSDGVPFCFGKNSFP